MMIKNYSLYSLIKLLPKRVLIDLIAMAYSLIVFDINRFNGILMAFIWVILHPGYLFREHSNVQKIRVVSDDEIMKNMFKGSIALTYYLKGKKRVSEL